MRGVAIYIVLPGFGAWPCGDQQHLVIWRRVPLEVGEYREIGASLSGYRGGGVSGWGVSSAKAFSPPYCYDIRKLGERFKAPVDVKLGAQGHAPTVKHPRTRMSVCQRRYQHSKGGGDAMR